MQKEFFIVGNWKMHKTISESQDFVHHLSLHLQGYPLKIGLAIPFTSLSSVKMQVKEKKIPIMLGAQNMHEKLQGAFTGEISALMLKDAGASFVLLGHSERRHIFHESDEVINEKIHRALQEKLKVIFCIGEQLKEKEEGKTQEVLQRQIEKGLQGIKSLDDVMIAYEPVWAIGTGKVAHSEDAQSIHAYCRKEIAKKFGQEEANKLFILYGGSVQPDNASSLAKMPDINGLLVGGASLKIESFFQILERVN